MAKKEYEKFHILLLGIIFDAKTRRILIGRKDGDPELGKKFTWGFPGTELFYNYDPRELLIKKLKEKTGYKVDNLGVIFTKVYPENKDLIALYYLCQIIGGKLKVGGFFKEMEWIRPEEIEKRFTTSFHPRLKEYIMNLK